jgi:hypothetical protein
MVLAIAIPVPLLVALLALEHSVVIASYAVAIEP